MFNIPWWLIVIVVILIALKFFFERFSPEQKVEQLPYRKAFCLLTPAEKDFFQILEPIAKENNLYLFTKVRLLDILWLPNGYKYQPYRTKVWSKHVDFLLCDRNLEPKLVIELDDSTHQKEARIKRDEFLTAIFKNISLPFLRIPTRKSSESYDFAGLSREIIFLLHSSQKRV